MILLTCYCKDHCRCQDLQELLTQRLYHVNRRRLLRTILDAQETGRQGTIKGPGPGIFGRLRGITFGDTLDLGKLLVEYLRGTSQEMAFV